MIAILLSLSGQGMAEEPLVFGRDVLPILSENCFHCHGPDEKGRQADLRLDTHEGVLAELNGHRTVKPGDAGASELIRRVQSTDPDEMMPPPSTKKTLSPQQITLLQRWINEGAVWGKHWAFEPLVSPGVPNVPAGFGTVVNPIDQFILTRLQKEKLSPAPPVDKATLIRRVTLDLTGLPPTPEEVDAFLADNSPQAYENLVDRLLASPRYGERMVWEWLEAARYADSNGYQGDNERTMWPWRDWAVSAFNDNLPFDQFTIWQLAGDQLPEATREQKLATGFLRNHMINGEGGRIAAENRVDYVMDMTETTGTVWLALTMNCCRCHDHKFDPVTNAEYYQLFDFFNHTPVDGGGGNPQTPPVLEMPSTEQARQLETLQAEHQKSATELATLESGYFRTSEGLRSQSPLAVNLTDEQKKLLDRPAAERDANQLQKLIESIGDLEHEPYQQQLSALKSVVDRRNSLNGMIPRVMVMADQPTRRETFILSKGLYNKPTEKKVSADTPHALPLMPTTAAKNRLGLAQWLVAKENPLTARVVVNRFWQQVFGIGLVKTSEDFGVQGEKPSHPELLDWLAADFRDQGWNVKALMKQIVMSATYRQSSRVTPDLVERDPLNRLLARGARYRLPAWMIRDQALVASGLFVEQVGGPPVKPYQPEGVWEEATFGNKRYTPDTGEALYRRSLYTFWRRIVGPTMFFDVAPRQTCVVKPVRTNTPLQALAIMNDVQYIEAARVLAEHAIISSSTPPDRLHFAFRRVLGRPARSEELAVLTTSYERQLQEFQQAPQQAEALLKLGSSPRDGTLNLSEHAALTGVCLILLNMDETLTRE
ncbi:MAG: DUF1553 domain-containing protein [Planctomycetota bacterium]|nr:MAG: DUF1553 domain-containing protein [Planctomycetota bacterium]